MKSTHEFHGIGLNQPLSVTQFHNRNFCSSFITTLSRNCRSNNILIHVMSLQNVVASYLTDSKKKLIRYHESPRMCWCWFSSKKYIFVSFLLTVFFHHKMEILWMNSFNFFQPQAGSMWTYSELGQSQLIFQMKSLLTRTHKKGFDVSDALNEISRLPSDFIR